MKIQSLKTFVVGNPPPFHGGRYFVFLKLVTDDGIEGVGEVYAATFAPKTVVAMIEDVFEHHVLGADPFGIERLWRNVYGRGYSLRPDLSLMGVLSGIEMAFVGHRRQGGRQACLSTSGRPSPRPAAQLYLSLPARRERRACLFGLRRLRRSGRGRGARSRLCEARLHGREVRSGGRLFDLRPAPAEPRAARAVRTVLQTDQGSGRAALRPPLRHAWPVHDLGRDPPRQADRALRSIVVRGAGSARDCRRKWPSWPARLRFRSRQGSGSPPNTNLRAFSRREPPLCCR